MREPKYLSLLLIIAILLVFATVTVADQTNPDPSPRGVEQLTIGVNKNFSPYEFANEQGEPDGFTVDLFKAVAEILQLEPIFILQDWAQVRQGLDNSRLDAVSGMLYSTERETHFDFSISHSTISYSLFIRKGSPIRELSHIKGRKIIVVEDVYAHDWLKEHTDEENIVPVNSSRTALELLASSKYDCSVLPRLHGLSLIKKLQIPNVEIIGPATLEQKFAFAVAEGNSRLLADLNEALFTLQLSGRFEEIYLKWFSVEEEKKNLQQFKKLILPITAAVGVILVTVLLWNKTLKSTVDRKTAEIELNHQRLHQILEGVPVPTYVLDCHGLVTHWNAGCEVLTGQPENTMLGTKKYEELLYPQQSKSMGELLLTNTLKNERQQIDGVTYRRSRFLTEAYETELYFPHQGIDGQWFYVSAAILRDRDGKKLGVIECRQDLTEIKLLERQLIQSQKMEALGTLAGGVAHDFNNILTSIIGTAELASLGCEDDGKLREYLTVILAGGRRGKDLTQQILAFSSQATVQPQRVSVTSLAQETLTLLGSTCPENIQIVSNIQPTREIIADPTHIHQIIMNLCTNALHALGGENGTIEVGLDNYTVEQESSLTHQLYPGHYIRLTVADDGPGIDEQVKSRIYDPFFTTKKRGEGTGMGLSVTAGIIHQYEGGIICNSRPGAGTVFQVYLPVGEDSHT